MGNMGRIGCMGLPLGARAGFTRHRIPHATCRSAAAVGACASRHSSSLPPPPLSGATSSLPVDYYLPFGKPSLLIPTLRSHDSVSSSSTLASTLGSVMSSGSSAPMPQTCSSSETPFTLAHPRPSTSASRPFLQAVRIAPSLPKTTSSSPAPRGQQAAEEPLPHLPHPESPSRRTRAPSGDEPEGVAAEADSVAEESTAVEADAGVGKAVRHQDTIHILGGNQQATYLAHLLAAIPKTSAVRMLLLDRRFAQKWHEGGKKVQVLRGGRLLKTNHVVGQFVRKPTDAAIAAQNEDASSSARTHHRARPGQRHIHNLIVTNTGVSTINAIARVRHLIDHRTTICLVQQGLGVVERLTELFFQDPETRPAFILGHMSHDLGYGGDFTASELRPGKLVLSLCTPPFQRQKARPESGTSATSSEAGTPVAPSMSAEAEETDVANAAHTTAVQSSPQRLPSPSADRSVLNDGSYFLHLLGITPELGAGGYPMGEFLRRKLPDMLFAAAAEPVSTILDLAPGDALMQNGDAWGLMHDLVDEMLNVVRQMPEARKSPRLLESIHNGALHRQVFRRMYRHGSGATSKHANGDADYYGASHRSAPSYWQRNLPCAMALRVARGRRTDIQYLNGYFVRRGQELGVACPMNEMVVRVVQAKRMAAKRRIDQGEPIPYDLSCTSEAVPLGSPESRPLDGKHPSQPQAEQQLQSQLYRPRVSAAGKFATRLPTTRNPQHPAIVTELGLDDQETADAEFSRGHLAYSVGASA